MTESSSILPENYQKDLRPNLNQSPVKIKFSMKMNSISQVNMDTMVCTPLFYG